MMKVIWNKVQIFFVIFSTIFGMIYSLSYQLLNYNFVGIRILEVIMAGAVCFALLNIMWIIIRKFTGSDSYGEKKYGLRSWLVFWFVSMAGNILCLLTYFPGVGMNDGLNILLWGMSQSGQFPVFYCAVLTVLARIGSVFGTLQMSVAIYSILQIIVVSAIYAWIILWFLKKSAPDFMKYIVIIYFVVEPLLAMYAIAMLRDTLFSLLLIVFVLLLYDLFIEQKEFKTKSDHVFFAVVLVGIMYTRNNGSYIVLPILIIMFFCCSKYRKQMLFFICVAFAALVISKVAMSYFQQEQLFQEMVGIPLQQIAAVVANNGAITEKQADFINQIMPLEEMAARYHPESVDYIKWQNDLFDRAFLNDHKKEFLSVWVQMMGDNKEIYLKSYLQQTFWFWAPQQRGPVQCFYSIETVADNQWLIDFLQSSGIHDQPLLPEKLRSVLCWWFGLGERFLREGVCFWIMLASLLLLILKNKNLRYVWVFSPVILLWATIMISTPVAASMRYVLVLVYGLPLFIGMLFIDPKNNKTGK